MSVHNFNTDSFLMEAFHRGDKLADEFVFRKFFKPLCLSAEKITKDLPQSEDIVLEVFVKIFNRRTDFPSLDNLKAFAIVATRNGAISYLRSLKQYHPISPDISDTLPDESGEMLQLEMMRWEVVQEIYNRIDDLPDRCRAVLKLFLKGHSTKAIADQLDISPQTVRTQKARGLQLIRAEIFGGKIIPLLLLIPFFFDD